MNLSEFRKDLVSGEWIIVSPNRFKRPGQFKKDTKRVLIPKTNCPFEDPQKTGHGQPSIVYPVKKNGSTATLRNWEIQVIENKFPAISHKDNSCASEIKRGLFSVMGGVGHHDLVLTKDHYKNFAHLSPIKARQIFKIFKERYLMLANDKCLKYIFILHNWGPKAGASIFHPHYQILSMPIIPPDVERSINGSDKYFKKHKRCVHCDMIKDELKENARVVYQNKEVEVVAPFVSKGPFELRVFTKKHFSNFEKTPDNVMEYVVDALQKTLLKIEKKLGDPDYNFFIHTAPLGNDKKNDHYHWHIEILPKVSIYAGLELGTGIEIITVDPEMAAKILR